MSGFDWLACPHCTEPLSVEGRVARCPAGHAFDVARQGYLNLLGRAQGANADTPDMVARRAAFLEAGFYSPIAHSVMDAAGVAKRVLDCGAGTGWYLAQVCDAADAEGLGLDVSVAAARRMAKASPRMQAIVADAWQRLPVQDACVDTVLSIFAPRNPEEFARVLRPGGRVVTVTPRPGHLCEARQRLGLMSVEPDKDARLAQAMDPFFAAGPAVEVDADLDLSVDQVGNLVGMGPNALHGHGAPVALRTRAEVTVRVWSRRV